MIVFTPMNGRQPLLRMLVMVGAAIQLLSPGVAAIADGLLARSNASGPLTHIEATTTATCPVVHAPDCGVCRYLSAAGTPQRATPSLLLTTASAQPRCEESRQPVSAATLQPNGRAPPVL